MAARRGQAPPQLGWLEQRLGAELVHPRAIAVGIVGESARQIGTEETNDFVYQVRRRPARLPSPSLRRSKRAWAFGKPG